MKFDVIAASPQKRANLSLRAKVVASIVWMALLCLLPSFSIAQGVLPIQWEYSPITQVQSVAYSPDGSLVAMGGIGGIQIYTVSTGTITCLPTTATSGVYSVAFSPNGKTLAAGGYTNAPNGVVELWNVSAGTLITTFNTAANYGVNAVAFSPDGLTLADGGISYNAASSTEGGVLETWNISTGALKFSFNTAANNGVNSVAFSPDGTALADGGAGVNTVTNLQTGILESWKTATGQAIQSYGTAANSAINSVTFSKDGSTLADGGVSVNSSLQSGVIEAWNFSSGQLAESLPTTASQINSVAFYSDGLTLADGGSGVNPTTNAQIGVVEAWYLPTSTSEISLNTAATNILGVVFSPDSLTLTDVGSVTNPSSGYSYGLLDLWSVNSGLLTASISTASQYAVYSEAVSPDGGTLFDGGFGSTGGILSSWNANSGAQISNFNTAANAGVLSVAVSPDGSTLADGGYGIDSSGNYFGLVELWDIASGRSLGTLATNSNNAVYSVAFSPDGKTLAVGGQGYDITSGLNTGIIELWSVASQTLTSSLSTTADNYVASVAFSPDGKTLADGCYSSLGGLVELWNVSNGSLISSLGTAADGGVNVVAFSTDGTLVADGGEDISLDGVLEVWNTSSGKLVSTPTLAQGTEVVSALVFSSDDRTLFAGTSYNLQAFNASAFNLLHYYSDPRGVTTVTLTPTGNLLAYGTASGALVVNQNPLFVAGWLKSLAVAPTTVVSGSTAVGTVTLGSPAPSGGTSIKLSSNSSSAVISSSVTVAAGATSATFKITTTPIGSSTSATITASQGNTVLTASLTLTPLVPTAVSVSPTSVLGGTPSTGTVTLNSAAPAGGTVVNLTSSSSSAVVPSTVTIAAGASTGTFTITTSVVATSATATITATLGSTSVNTTLTITPPGLTGLTLSPTSLQGGNSSTGTLTLSGPAPTGGDVVSLTSSSSSAVVPSSVTVAAGATSATFTITTSAVANSTTATISGVLGTVTKTATLTVNSAGLTGLTVSPTTLVGSLSATGTVTLGGPAPTGGTVINVSSSSASATTPATVTVPAGATSATFTIKTTSVATAVTATITASLGTATKTATLAINPLSVTSLSLNPTSVTGGDSSIGTVTLNGPAPTGGIAVTLISSNPSAATVPASVTVAAGQLTATFSVSTPSVLSQVAVTLKASYQSSSMTANLTVNPVTILTVTLNPSTVSGGVSSSGTVTMTGPAPKNGFVVKLSSSSKKATVVSTIKINQGGSSTTFTVKTSIVATPTPITITATVGAASESAVLTVNPPSLLSLSLTPATVIGLTASKGTATLSGAAPAGGMIVKLSSSDSAASVPASVTIPAGATHASFTIKTVSVASATPATITGTLNGISESAGLTINPPSVTGLSLSPSSLVGGKTSTGTVTLGTAAPAGGISVSLSSSSTSATLPASVIVLAGKTSAKFTVTTTAVTAQVVAKISAALASTSKSANLTIKK